MSVVATWEYVASTQITDVLGECVPGDHWLAYAEAYRKADLSDDYYGVTLARESGLGDLKLEPPKFPDVKPSDTGGIIVCPYGLKTDFALPITVWIATIKLLWSYGVQVRMMGEEGQRMESAAFSEDEMLSRLSLQEKIEILASAKLILGVPNAWTWIGTAWNKKTIMLYPDHLPRQRWFPVIDDSNTSQQRWLLYQPYQIQIPIMLVALRRLLQTL